MQRVSRQARFGRVEHRPLNENMEELKKNIVMYYNKYMTKSRKQLIKQQAEERHARWHERSMNKRGVHKPIYKLKPPPPIQLSASDQESDQESDRVYSSTKTKKNRPNIARISLNAVKLYAPDMQLSNMAQELGEDMMRNLDHGAPENLGDNTTWDKVHERRAALPFKNGGTRRKRNRNNASKRLRKRKHHGKTLRRK